MGVMRKTLMIILAVVVMLAVGCGSSEKEKLAFRDAGISQMDAGEYEAALQSFQQALEASDGLVGAFELDVLKYRAEAQMRTGAYGASAHTYSVLSQVDEERPEYRTREFIMYVMADQLDAALETYEKAYELDAAGEEFTQGFLLLGERLQEAGRAEEAMAIYETAVNDGSQSGELYNRMALCEIEAGEYDQALAYLEQGMAADDAQARAKLLYNQVVVYEQKLDFAKALVLLEQYAAEFGTTPEVEKELAFLRTR